ncbi:alpha/beta hydrolase [Rhizobium sp. BK251]|uniref:alpha/beta fold hydrolase n=1 Tax=Rhizobium sp. BK251 TaxID=2512125 RepID=UPI001049D353|nr:alpha/beta hydrolase [Rhizobium sp. BK251]TCL64089.1 pimeloyl-ACP methyl ester carboxylesterase [Rhizobium sp. BK251]
MSEAGSFMTEDGTRLNLDSAGAGPAVVFQHGLCGDAGQTREAFPSDCGYQRFTVEARGHGSSEPGDLRKLSIATFADDLAGFIEQELGVPVVVGGISMGAAICLRLAVRRPDLVRALVIARPAWIAAAAPANMRANAEVGHLLRTLEPKAAKAAFLASETGRRLAKEAPDNLASLTGFFARQPIQVTATLLTAIAGDGPGVTEEEIGNLAIPTLVIGHQQDLIHPLSHAHSIAGCVPAAKFVEITPKVVNRAQYVSDFHTAMRNFLREL